MITNQSNKVAVMQPYIFPYIGYFQLISAVDTFVFYDDVNFIKGGWINRNKILGPQGEILFTVPLSKISSYKSINEVEINKSLYGKWKKKFLKSILQSYSKAPYLESTYELIEKILESNSTTIADLAIHSILNVSEYLGFKVQFMRSSQDFSNTQGLERSNRLYEICKALKSNHYINSIGGKELYDKELFKKQGIELEFLKAEITPYNQSKVDFVPGLSIIDILMFNSKEETDNLLDKYTVV